MRSLSLNISSISSLAYLVGGSYEDSSIVLTILLPSTIIANARDPR